MRSRACTLVLNLSPDCTLLPGRHVLQACHICVPDGWAEQHSLVAVQVGLLTMLALTLRASPAAAVLASEQLLQAGKRFTSPARLPLLLWALNQAARWGPRHVQQKKLPCPWLPALHLASSAKLPGGPLTPALHTLKPAGAAPAGQRLWQAHCFADWSSCCCWPCRTSPYAVAVLTCQQCASTVQEAP